MDNEQLKLLKERITFDEAIFGDNDTYIKVLTQLLEDSKNIALSIRFPYEDYSLLELPAKYKNWQLRCCFELYQGVGKENIKSYSENGISWTKDSGNISNDLLEEIMPMVGVIRDV